MDLTKTDIVRSTESTEIKQARETRERNEGAQSVRAAMERVLRSPRANSGEYDASATVGVEESFVANRYEAETAGRQNVLVRRMVARGTDSEGRVFLIANSMSNTDRVFGEEEGKMVLSVTNAEGEKELELEVGRTSVRLNSIGLFDKKALRENDWSVADAAAKTVEMIEELTGADSDITWDGPGALREPRALQTGSAIHMSGITYQYGPLQPDTQYPISEDMEYDDFMSRPGWSPDGVWMDSFATVEA